MRPYLPSLLTLAEFSRILVDIAEPARNKLREKLRRPRGSFSGHDLMTPWSKLQELYFVGYAFLNYLSSPFNLAEPGFEVTEIEPHEENGETWRRMVVRLAIFSHRQRQVFDVPSP